MYVHWNIFSVFSGDLTKLDAPTTFRIAGFDTQKSQWISGLNNIFYMVRPEPCQKKSNS
jgi:hypothetical protein